MERQYTQLTPAESIYPEDQYGGGYSQPYTGGLTGETIDRPVPLNPIFNPQNTLTMDVTLTTTDQAQNLETAKTFITSQLRAGDWAEVQENVLRVTGQEYLNQGPREFIANLKTIKPDVILFEDFLPYPSTMEVLRQVIKEYRAQSGRNIMAVYCIQGDEPVINITPGYEA